MRNGMGKWCIECQRKENERLSGLTKRKYEKNRHGRKMQAWSKAVRARDGKCGFCHATEELEAHHLEGWAANEGARYDISNGVAMCKVCHFMFHDKYGWGANTKAQFAEYLRDRIVSGDYAHGRW